jgi:flavin-dependent dehydrogenase
VANIQSHQDQNAAVKLANHHGQQDEVRPDVLVLTDGGRSSTAQKLGIERTQVLPSIPVIAAIFKDDRPEIRNIKTAASYLKLTAEHTAKRIYYTSLFLFKVVFQHEHIFAKNRKIAGALIFQIPGMHYLGFGLNKDLSEKLSTLVERMKKANSSDDLKKATEERDQFIQHWSYLSFCAGNLIAMIQTALNLFSKKWKNPNFAFWKPIDMQNTAVFDIKVEKADRFWIKAGKTAVLVGGDAAATVDPVTGLGCNTALLSSEFYEIALEEFVKFPNCHKEILNDYQQFMSSRVTNVHERSLEVRMFYRPDAV